MPEGPLGFPRLTSIGPFVEERETIRGEDELLEWKRSMERSSECDKIKLLVPDIEVVINPPQSVDVLEIVPHNREDILLSMDRNRERINNGETMLFHETVTPDSIRERGFTDRDKFLFVSSPIRDGGAFFWLHPTDIGQRTPDAYREENARVVVSKAKVDNGKVYSTSSLDYINNVEGGHLLSGEKFDNIFSSDLRTYIECLQNGVVVSKDHNKDTLPPNMVNTRGGGVYNA